MTFPTKHYILKDSNTPTVSVNIYMIKRATARPTNVFNNTKHILDNGDISIDYGTDKRIWNFEIEIDETKLAWFTLADLTKIESLYALRKTQTIKLVDNWTGTGSTIDVHFVEFQKQPHSQTGCWTYTLRLIEK